MSDQDWPPASVGLAPVPVLCPLMPAERHCLHEQRRVWDDPFPPALVCCWCGGVTEDLGAVPHRHGPYLPKE